MIFSLKKKELFLGVFVFLFYISLLAAIVLMANGRGLQAENVFSPEGTDAHEYVSLAQTLVSSQRYAMYSDSPPEYFRSPGYPMFIAPILYVTDSMVVLIIAQILLVSVSAVFIYKIGAELFSQWVGLTATIVFVLDPAVITTALATLTEPLFIALLLGTTWVLLREHSTRNVILAGVLMGALILTRPVGIFLAPLFVCLLIYKENKDLKTILIRSAAFVGVSVVVFVPWMIRNVYLSGHFSLSSISTYNMLFYNVVEFEVQKGAPKTEFIKGLQERLGSNSDFELRSFDYAAEEQALIHEYLTGHVFSYALFHLTKTAPFFLGSSLDVAERHLFGLGLLDREPGPSANISGLLISGDVEGVMSLMREHFWITGERICWLLLTILALSLPVVLFFKKDSRAAIALLFSLLILLFAILAGPVSHPRYRIPAEPFLLILAFGNIYVISKAIWAAYAKKFI